MVYGTHRMNGSQPISPARQAAVNGLAMVGFIALVGAGVWLAIYSTRFVPTVVNGVGAAAVYLGSVLTPAPDSSLSVVPTPTASTTIPFGTATTTSATTTQVSPAKPSKPSYPIVTAPAPPAPYGLPDLAVQISAVGYVTCDSQQCFVPSASVPSGYKPAVKFNVKNNGTNVTGIWNLNVSVPGQDQKFDNLESMLPGAEATYVAWVTDARTASTQTIAVTVNYDGSVTESNTGNNTSSANVQVL
ncbi:MAG: hypothetical protein UY97_C0025G0009 [Parcubacteria group bacterium GW2011_GWB1_57_6]|nr:MAG: hypothetical protein UY93_C0002G0097 [Parcubacteria group bacterium GW2011_GWA1_56_13]KKW45345.1 MAG: hypothetical protein UY97_C0025G0009 [Parcubacteria group bacterium GW2011_GWB1_57_6]